jgi:hypothetical protein
MGDRDITSLTELLEIDYEKWKAMPEEKRNLLRSALYDALHLDGDTGQHPVDALTVVCTMMLP